MDCTAVDHRSGNRCQDQAGHYPKTLHQATGVGNVIHLWWARVDEVRQVRLSGAQEDLIGDALGVLWQHEARRAEVQALCEQTGIALTVD